MGHSLTITYGSVTLDLGDQSNYAYLNYVPNTPREGDTEVVESWKLLILGATTDEVEENKRALDRAWQAARNLAETGAGDRVFINHQKSDTSAMQRSELYYGKAQYGPESMGAEWAIKQVEAIIAWRRAPWWEDPEETLETTNNSGTGASRTVYNHDDSGTNEDMYVEIAAADIAGDLPAPLIVEITNLSAAATQKLYLALGAIADVDSFPHVLEGESATGGSSTGADTSLYSNGAYRARTIAGDAENDFFTWTLSSALLTAARSATFRIFSRFVAAPTDIKTRLKILHSTYVLKKTKQRTMASDKLQELGSLRLPPAQLRGSTIHPLSLVVSGQKTGGATLEIDSLFILPTDGWREYRPIGAGLEQNATLIDNQVSGTVYTTNHATAGNLPDYEAYGKLELQPGMVNRLYLLATTTSGASPIGQQHSLVAKYRPRYRG